MATRLEKLETSLKREQEKQDNRRMKKGVEYLEMGLQVLKDKFHSEENTMLASGIFDGIDEPLAEIKSKIVK